MENNRIRELRKNLSLSQEALAEKIGTTQQAVSRMENNANAGSFVVNDRLQMLY